MLATYYLPVARHYWHDNSGENGSVVRLDCISIHAVQTENCGNPLHKILLVTALKNSTRIDFSKTRDEDFNCEKLPCRYPPHCANQPGNADTCQADTVALPRYCRASPGMARRLIQEPLNKSSPRRRPGSSLLISSMIRFAYPAGRSPGAQHALRFCPACAGMTKRDLFRVSLICSSMMI